MLVLCIIPNVKAGTVHLRTIILFIQEVEREIIIYIFKLLFGLIIQARICFGITKVSKFHCYTNVTAKYRRDKW